MKYNKLFSGLALGLLLMSSTSLLANPIVVLSENQADYVQTETGYVLHFELTATAAELAELETKAATQADRVTMSVTLVSEGKYSIVYTVDHQNQPEYVHKMMLTTGFNDINYKGSDFGLNKIVDVLYSYQN